MNIPPVTQVRQLGAHRLVNARHGETEEDAFAEAPIDDASRRDLRRLGNTTSDRRIAEANQLPGIGVDELVFGIPHHGIVNAAFSHAHPLGGRFNGPERGAWHAGFELETAQAETAWRKSVEFAEAGRFEGSVAYDDHLADFTGGYHDIREDASFGNCLDPGDYAASQSLAETLLDEGSPGIVYPGVRRDGGACIACFRPALVGNVRKRARYRFTWSGFPEPDIELEEAFT